MNILKSFFMTIFWLTSAVIIGWFIYFGLNQTIDGLYEVINSDLDNYGKIIIGIALSLGTFSISIGGVGCAIGLLGLIQREWGIED